MIYEFSFPLNMMGGLASEIDMQAEISGSHEDWTVDQIDVWVLKAGNWQWLEMPREHQMRPQVMEYLLSPDTRARIDEAYADHIAETEGPTRPWWSEHKMLVRELV